MPKEMGSFPGVTDGSDEKEPQALGSPCWLGCNFTVPRLPSLRIFVVLGVYVCVFGLNRKEKEISLNHNACLFDWAWIFHSKAKNLTSLFPVAHRSPPSPGQGDSYLAGWTKRTSSRYKELRLGSRWFKQNVIFTQSNLNLICVIHSTTRHD